MEREGIIPETSALQSLAVLRKAPIDAFLLRVSLDFQKRAVTWIVN